MKGSSHSPLVCGVVVMVVSLVCYGPPLTTAASDGDYYVTTELDDPLQPVWDKLDDLPRLVSNDVQNGLQSQFMGLNRNVDTKLQGVETSLRAATTALNNLQESRTSAGTPGNGQHPSSDLRYLLENGIPDAVMKIEGHINAQVLALETRLQQFIARKISEAAVTTGDGSVRTQTDGGSSLSETLQANTATLENINTHVLKINEKLGGGGEDGDSCGTLVDKVSELMGAAGGGGGGACRGLDQQTATAISTLSQSNFFMPRDCSDKHWQQPEAPSGVYETYPTLDSKNPVKVYCDMGQRGAKDTGGWTVLLRRRNTSWGLVNFNRTWSEYRDGFGDPGEGEWWYGLGSLHALTYRQPFEVDLLLHDIEHGTYNAKYNSFRVEDEAHLFKLNLNGFMGNLTHDALIAKHHGSPFSTWDRDNDVWASGSCAQRNGGGWWFNACHYTTLTAPFPTSNNREESTIRWLEDDWLVLDDVTLKIRPVNYADRFNAQSVG